jgi:phenylalanyl-tRNA synthetase alpha chain
MASSSSPAPPADLASAILHALAETSPLSTTDAFPSASFADLKAALDRLAPRNMITYSTIDREEVLLEPEGAQIVAHGSHEVRVFEALRAAVAGLSVQELEAQIGDKTVVRAGQGNAFKAKWIAKGADGRFVAKVDSVGADATREQLARIQETRTHEQPAVVAALKKRKLVRTQKVISFTVARGDKFALEMVKEETDLTAEMLASGAWRDAKFKAYNFRALGADQTAGALHPLNKVRAEFRQIFFEMGFTEMSTASFVESGFWCFDALFVPRGSREMRRVCRGR